MAAKFPSAMLQMVYKLTELPSLLIIHLKQYYWRGFEQVIYEPPYILHGPTAECRFRLDTDSSATITLPEGRKLGYAEYGPRVGNVIFYLHGLPDSRLEIAFLEPIAVKLHIRIIAIDRPGFGWSSPQPNRTVLDHAKDVQYLANQLELDSYGVLGISAGGAYALACAASLPANQLKAVSIVCGLGPPEFGYRGMNWTNWLGFTFVHRMFPGIVRWWIGRDVAARLDLSDEERFEILMKQISKTRIHPKEIPLYNDVDRLRLYVRSTRQAYSQGLEAHVQDAQVLSKDFGFRIEDIRSDLPIQLLYGSLDTNVPLSHGKQIAAKLSYSVDLRIEEETHTSVVKEQMLEDLIRAM